MNTIQKYYDLKQEIRKEFIKYFYANEEEEDLGYYFHNSNEAYWIGNGNIMGISDVFINLEDIIYILEHKIPLETFLDHYWYSVESEDRVNLQSYIKIRGGNTHEYYLKFEEEQKRIRETPEHKAEVEASLKKIWDDGIKKIEKHLKNK